MCSVLDHKKLKFCKIFSEKLDILDWLLEWQAVEKQCRSAAQQGWADSA